jgi:transposase
LKPKEVIQRYKSLADIERGFRVLKSELEIGPVYHRLPDRIRAHTTLCFIALILYRIMRMRLRAANAKISPDRALETLRRIQHHQIRLNQATPITGLSSISPEQVDLFKALNVKKPTST